MKIWLSDGALVERVDPFAGPVMPFRQEIFDSKRLLKVRLVSMNHSRGSLINMTWSDDT
jgi:hypothetical protein